MMRTITKSLLAGTAALAFSASFASAEIVCNEDGDCWRVRERHVYKPELRLKVYPNDWRWEERDRDRYRWREAPSERRGYWRQGIWVEIGD